MERLLFLRELPVHRMCVVRNTLVHCVGKMQSVLTLQHVICIITGTEGEGNWNTSNFSSRKKGWVRSPIDGKWEGKNSSTVSNNTLWGSEMDWASFGSCVVAKIGISGVNSSPSITWEVAELQLKQELARWSCRRKYTYAISRALSFYMIQQQHSSNIHHICHSAMNQFLAHLYSSIIHCGVRSDDVQKRF